MNLLSSLLQVLAYPPFSFWFLSWVALVPWFRFLSKSISVRQAFWGSYLCGIIFWAGSIYWVGYVTILGAVVLILYLSLYWAVFGMFFFWLWKRKTNPWVFLSLSSSGWGFLEWVRTYLFTGFGWNLLAYSQTPNLAFIQIADTIGAFGVSFLLVWVNGAIFLTVIARLPKAAEAISMGVGTLFLIALVYSYGFFRLNEKIPTEPIRVAVIQGNIPQAIKWDPDYQENIFQKYELLSRQAKLDSPSLIIWPETSIPEDLTQLEVQERIANLARSIETPLLVGAFVSSKNHPWEEPYYNSAVLFDSNGNLVNRYDKLHLVPFGEFIPFERQFSILRDWIVTGNFISGEDYVIFDFPNSQLPAPSSQPISFSVLICFEDIFPGLVHPFVQKGARFLVNISNDAWFHESGAPFQHAQASIFRAIENRVPVVRSTNTGYSSFIDSQGRIIKEVKAFTTGYATATIQVPLKQK